MSPAPSGSVEPAALSVTVEFSGAVAGAATAAVGAWFAGAGGAYTYARPESVPAVSSNASVIKIFPPGNAAVAVPKALVLPDTSVGLGFEIVATAEASP